MGAPFPVLDRPNPGRPTKHTPERELLLLEALRAGNTRKAASAAAGIHQDTMLDWVNADPAFSDQCVRAEMEAERAAVGRIREAGRGHELIRRDETTTTRKNGDVVTRVQEEWSQPQWLAEAWWLERKNAEEWGKREPLAVFNVDARQVTLIAPDLGTLPARPLVIEAPQAEGAIEAVQAQNHNTGATFPSTGDSPEGGGGEHDRG